MRTLLCTVACATLLVMPARVPAQSLRQPCAGASSADARMFCENVADAVLILQPRIGAVLAAGNPVPGTASTLGMRIGSTPRVSVGLRMSAARPLLPPIERINDDGSVRFTAASIGLDVSVGLFEGISLAPTVGGFGSVDLLASFGVMPLPRGDDFPDNSPLSVAAGARIGLLRESFTAPGISVSAMYRRVGDVARGSRDLSGGDSYLRISDYGVTSLRGTVGKRVLGFGLTAGVGYDLYRADADVRVRDPGVLVPSQISMTQDGLKQDRVSLFGNASLTMLILNMAVEVGWQQGGDGGAATSDELGRGGLFGGLALRLAI